MTDDPHKDARKKFQRYPPGIRRIVNKLMPANNTHEFDRLDAAKMIHRYAKLCVKWRDESWRWPGKERETDPLFKK